VQDLLRCEISQDSLSHVRANRVDYWRAKSEVLLCQSLGTHSEDKASLIVDGDTAVVSGPYDFNGMHGPFK
jgi:hypothetical protein